MARVRPIQCQETIGDAAAAATHTHAHTKQKTWHKFYLVRIWLEWYASFVCVCEGNVVLFSTNSQYPDCETADELHGNKSLRMSKPV